MAKARFKYTHLVIPGVAILLILLSGCSSMATAGLTRTTVAVAEERSMGDIIDDTAIWAQVNSSLLQKNMDDLYRNVNVEVNEGRVLLTGAVKNDDLYRDATRAAWQVKGVHEVINEVQVTNEDSVKGTISDYFLTKQVQAKLLLSKKFASVNYNVDAINGVVYLFGLAGNEKELNEVSELASTVQGVKKVISHVRLKDDPLRKNGVEVASVKE